MPAERCGRGHGDETKEELSFVASAVRDSAGWHAAKFKCDRQWQKEGFKFYDIANR